jgi:ABC-type lipoprotein export system ATPase subunit
MSRFSDTASPVTDEVIRLEGIRKTYRLGEQSVEVLRGVSLTIGRGEMISLTGASGSGKSTLMNLLGFLDRPTSGKYWFEGRDLSQLSPDERARIRGEKLGFVFQSFQLLARTSALNNVLLPLDYGPARWSTTEARERARSLLRRVGLGERMDHDPSQLSGGQQQRVAIARSLINEPSLLLADEPTGNLDSKTSREILALFHDLHRNDGLTIVLVTHDPHVAANAERVIRVSDGLIIEDIHNEPAAAGTT